MSFLVNPDSLLQRKGGIGVTDLQDVTIEGNAYKLFLYPFFLGSQELILAGLISESNYKEATQKIPFSFFTVFAVLLLLLVIHLPILRIYMIGPNERIRERDIRLIIKYKLFRTKKTWKLFPEKSPIISNLSWHPSAVN
jgi:hypothetical protein